MPNYQLAELNIAKMKAPLESPVMADFVDRLGELNRLAEQSPGFVWRLQTADGNATALRPLGEDMLVNVSVWQDLASLHAYTYKTVHGDFMRRRKEWFEPTEGPSVVLWWISAGHRPDAAEAIARLQQLHANGASPEAFSFRQSFPPPGV